MANAEADYTVEINGFTMKNSHCEKLWKLHSENHLIFGFHIQNIRKGANRKISNSDP